VARLSDDTRRKRLEAPWAKIVGLRHRLAHGYTSIDHSILWSVATTHVRELADIAGALLADLRGNPS
jgi:uncharacterized protein with HEPN domain